MKFTVAWAKVASENSILKTVIICLSLTSLFFGVSSLKLALKDPIVIDRSCFSKAVGVVDGKRTASEIEAFLREAISQRFDSQAVVRNDFLSEDEQVVRAKEQKDLQNRKLSQKIVLNSINVNGGNVVADADRLISVGEVRSAFRFPLNIKIESVTRTEGNPYGLVVSEVKAIEKGEK